MIYIALVLGIMLLVAAGVLAWKNSQIIAEKNEDQGPSSSSLQYTVHMTDKWEDQDSLSLISLFHTSYVVEERESQAHLCRVTGIRGELKLYEAENVMLHNIRHAKLKGSLLSGMAMFDLAMNEDEKEVLTRLERDLMEQPDVKDR
ncbi:hypothetical protein ACP8HI_05220 [Paenibacillus sp. FA6]|uniref:hypothetical protein n=1 Tax=Paenibacillus sp. FA6 TaxID=3413029 RepID=UPI003F659F3A